MNSIQKNFFHRSIVSGSTAGIASALAAAYAVNVRGHRPAAAFNAVSHCLWAERAFRQEKINVRYTALGAGIHIGSAIFWGVLFEALRGPSTKRMTPPGAAAVTAVVAYVVDYHVVPKRVTPGYDVHMSKRALAGTYVALALGFVLGAAYCRRR
jgi:hypothetical protein